MIDSVPFWLHSHCLSVRSSTAFCGHARVLCPFLNVNMIVFFGCSVFLHHKSALGFPVSLLLLSSLNPCLVYADIILHILGQHRSRAVSAFLYRESTNPSWRTSIRCRTQTAHRRPSLRHAEGYPVARVLKITINDSENI